MNIFRAISAFLPTRCSRAENYFFALPVLGASEAKISHFARAPLEEKGMTVV
jgi:hypothetical protein